MQNNQSSLFAALPSQGQGSGNAGVSQQLPQPTQPMSASFPMPTSDAPAGNVSHATQGMFPVGSTAPWQPSAAPDVRARLVSAHIRAQVQREYEVEQGTWSDAQEAAFSQSQAQFQTALDAEKARAPAPQPLDVAHLMSLPSVNMGGMAMSGQGGPGMRMAMMGGGGGGGGAPLMSMPMMGGGGGGGGAPLMSMPMPAPAGAISFHAAAAQAVAAADARGPDASAPLSVEHHPEGGIGGQWRPDPAAIQATLRHARGALLYVGEPLQGSNSGSSSSSSSGSDGVLPPTVSVRLNVGSMDRSLTEDCMASKAPVLVVVAFPPDAEQRSSALKHVKGSLLHQGRVGGVPAAEPALLAGGATDADAAALLCNQLSGPYGVYQLDPRAYPHKDTYDPELPFPQYMLFHRVGQLRVAGPWGMKGGLEPYAPAPQAAVVCAAAGCDVVFSFEGHPALQRGYRHDAGSDKGPPPRKADPKRQAAASGGMALLATPHRVAALPDLPAGFAAPAAAGGQGGVFGGQPGMPSLGTEDPFLRLPTDFAEDVKVAGWLARQPEPAFQAGVRLFIGSDDNKRKMLQACNMRIQEERCTFVDMLRWLFESAFEADSADEAFVPLLTGVVRQATMHSDTASQMSGQAQQDILLKTVQRGGDSRVLCSMVTGGLVALHDVPGVWATLEQCARSASQPGSAQDKGALFVAMMQLAATQVGCLDNLIRFCVADSAASSHELSERLEVVKLFVTLKAPAHKPQVVALLKQPSMKNNTAAAHLLAELGEGGASAWQQSALHDDDKGGYVSDGSL